MKPSVNTPATSIVAYYRVSTKRQSLGLDAQRDAVTAYATANNLTIIAEFQEKESGKENDRPILAQAMATARKYDATLVVAKTDRLSRNLSFAAHVFFESGLKVHALNLPESARANAVVFGVFYGLAQEEASLISQRTKAALAEKKAQGVKLGRPGATITDEMHAASAKARKEQADANDANLKAADELRRYFAGLDKRNMAAAARHLNARQLYTSRGVFHTSETVKRLITRYGI